MISCIYQGPPANVGRFSNLKKGDTILLTEEEGYRVRGNPDFKPDDDREGFPANLRPASGTYFDLLTLSWLTEKLFKDLKRLKKRQLVLVLCEMEAQGIPVSTGISELDAVALREEILTGARKSGWL